MSISDLHAYYGESHILHGIELSVRRGEVVTLLGRNGAGRTTILKSIMGLVGERSGSVRIAGKETLSLPPTASPGWGSATARRSGGSSRA